MPILHDPTSVIAGVLAPWKDDFGVDGVALNPRDIAANASLENKQVFDTDDAIDPEPDSLRQLGLAAIRWAIRLREQAMVWEAEARRRHEAGEPSRRYEEAPKNEGGGCADREAYERAHRSEAIAGLAASVREEADNNLMAAILMHFGMVDHRVGIQDIGNDWEAVGILIDGAVYIVAPDPHDEDTRNPWPELSVVAVRDRFEDAGLEDD